MHLNLNVSCLLYGVCGLHLQRMSASHPVCRMGMSALGWELPLDAICTNGRNAQEAAGSKLFAPFVIRDVTDRDYHAAVSFICNLTTCVLTPA
jgi:hypothetical protein